MEKEKKNLFDVLGIKKKNMFEKAQFGTPYMTIDNKIAIFVARHEDHISYMVKGEIYDYAIYTCDFEGKSLCTGEQALKPLVSNLHMLGTEAQWFKKTDISEKEHNIYTAGYKHALSLCRAYMLDDNEEPKPYKNSYDSSYGKMQPTSEQPDLQKMFDNFKTELFAQMRMYLKGYTNDDCPE